MSVISILSLFISNFCMSIILFFSSISDCMRALGPFEEKAATAAVSFLFFLLCIPRAASRSWICVLAIFSSLLKSLISLINETFSCKRKSMQHFNDYPICMSIKIRKTKTCFTENKKKYCGSYTNLHNADIVSSMDFRIFRQLLTKGGYRSF